MGARLLLSCCLGCWECEERPKPTVLGRNSEVVVAHTIFAGAPWQRVKRRFLHWQKCV